MLYITGDTHGESKRFSPSFWAEEPNLGADDFLIVCGDFGFLFYSDGTQKALLQQKELDRLEQKPYTILFADGNHENFDQLNRYPVTDWNGGKVHRIRRNIIHLMRGQVFTVEGKKIFTMGGAYSIDRYVRALGISYWNEELPCNAEYREATKNLAEAGNEVDYIITHTAPREIILRMGKYPDRHDAELTGFLEWIMYEVKFRQWFFGHWHTDCQVTEQFRALWYDTVTAE